MKLQQPDKDLARKILLEAQKRAQSKFKLKDTDFLFGEQKRFVYSLAKYVIALTGRQSGKSTGLAYLMCLVGLATPNSLIGYITTARETAKDIIWKPLTMLDEEFQLGLKFNQKSGDVIFPNGSRIVLRGAATKREADKLRGPVWALVVVDEAQNFGQLLKYLIEEVIEAATFRYQCKIVLTGTPNAACAGPFYEYAHNPEWDRYHWTMHDNIHIPDVEAQLRRMMKNKGWEETDPAFRREFLGQWVRDEEMLVFRFSKERNLIDRFEPESASDWVYVLGVDVGFNDPMAYCVLAYNDRVGAVRCIKSYKEDHQTPSEAAVEIERLRIQYDISRIVMDTGGIGKGYAEEFKKRFQLPVHPAKKQDKAAYVEFLNGDLRSGALKMVGRDNEELIEELQMLQWDLRRLAVGSYEYERGYADHLCDALLYAWRDCRHFWVATEYGLIGQAKPKQLSGPDAEAERFWAKKMKDVTTEKKAAWWEKWL